jgi:hypothetical protein
MQMEVEEHVSCKCGCLIKPKDCQKPAVKKYQSKIYFYQLTLNKLHSYPRSTPKTTVVASAPTGARPIRASKTASNGISLFVGILLSRFFFVALLYNVYRDIFWVYANLARLVSSLDVDNLKEFAATMF